MGKNKNKTKALPGLTFCRASCRRILALVMIPNWPCPFDRILYDEVHAWPGPFDTNNNKGLFYINVI